LVENRRRYIVSTTKSHSAEPNLRDHYRGALLESFEEVEILGKISIKGVLLLFFSDKKMVIRITDYLTVRMMVKDEQTCNQIKEVVSDMLCAQFLW